LLRRRASHPLALRFLDGAGRLPDLDIVYLEEDLARDAWRCLRAHDERPYSFVDATRFAIMRSRRIREALAFDADFAVAGFVEARP
jgi:predicted nucleic acid-binding protein